MLPFQNFCPEKKIKGIYSVCSAHPAVIQTAMKLAAEEKLFLLVEATANQVNQFGGYTGMTPARYISFIRRLAESSGLSHRQIMIGADHVGPHVWKTETASLAMEKAKELSRQLAAAGFSKIHLDTSARCKDDPGPELPPETSAKRAAELCMAAETAPPKPSNKDRLFYVVGNDVPAPGGSLEHIDNIRITDPNELIASIKLFERIFCDSGLESAWKRVMAVVVQPGVDFGHKIIACYNREKASALSAAFSKLPFPMNYEVHSTDYQSPEALNKMTDDNFKLLKAGPCLTFAFRESVYALENIEKECPGISSLSGLRKTMESIMKRHPEHWHGYYSGTEEERFFLRHYSYLDRIRYYWALTEAQISLEKLIRNLSRGIPNALIRQYLPDLYPEIESRELKPEPLALISRRIRNALRPYVEACSQ